MTATRGRDGREQQPKVATHCSFSVRMPRRLAMIISAPRIEFEGSGYGASGRPAPNNTTRVLHRRLLRIEHVADRRRAIRGHLLATARMLRLRRGHRDRLHRTIEIRRPEREIRCGRSGIAKRAAGRGNGPARADEARDRDVVVERGRRDVRRGRGLRVLPAGLEVSMRHAGVIGTRPRKLRADLSARDCYGSRAANRSTRAPGTSTWSQWPASTWWTWT